eukprot:937752-Rhodomonas_salina.2
MVVVSVALGSHALSSVNETIDDDSEGIGASRMKARIPEPRSQIPFAAIVGRAVNQGSPASGSLSVLGVLNS